MYAEILADETWRRKLEAAGFKPSFEPVEIKPGPPPAKLPNKR